MTIADAKTSGLPPEMEEDDDAAEPVLFRKPLREEADMDITPMIDMVFLLLIFFLVSSTPTMESFVDLPKARYGSGVSERTSTIITMADQGPNLPPAVYLGDGKVGQPLPEDPQLQEAEIVRAVEAGILQEGKSNVLLKAERGIKYREVSRVAGAASQVEGIKLHLAVTEAS